jgi:hypothetical protein
MGSFDPGVRESGVTKEGEPAPAHGVGAPKQNRAAVKTITPYIPRPVSPNANPTANRPIKRRIL